MNKLRFSYLLLKEIGLTQLAQYAVYKLGISTGHYRRITPIGGWKSKITGDPEIKDSIPFSVHPQFLEKTTDPERNADLEQACLICDGWYFPFSGEKSKLSFDPPEHPLEHWTSYGSSFNSRDIKFAWEPARFSWVFPLVHAYSLSPEDRYAETFWQLFEQFIQNNPVNQGPAWSSAQEVALRVIPWLWGYKVFAAAKATTPARRSELLKVLENSAKRILPTLNYARSQNNNHLLSEAIGLIAIGNALDGVHPSAKGWMQTGFQEFEYGILTQIDETGNYSQQSTNYHRLVLQLALMYYVYTKSINRKIPSEILKKISLSTRYLCSWMDATSGSLPNLGHNDGAFLLPFGAENYRDYRPTLQAASMIFTGSPILPRGKWDELSQWIAVERNSTIVPFSNTTAPLVLRVGQKDHWAVLHAVQYHSRPAHGDQLSVDLWWDGVNIAQDAGTYLYNAPQPWENALTTTSVHNTVMIDGLEQMVRAGKFLTLDRLNAVPLPDRTSNRVSAEIISNQRFRFYHKRILQWNPPYRFSIIDEIHPHINNSGEHQYALQWLLPDWQWKFIPEGIQLAHQSIQFQLRVNVEDSKEERATPSISLIRAGEPLFGDQVNPIRGWVSPTYGSNIPALSFSLTVKASTPIKLVSIFDFSPPSNKKG